jgi:hypothetical protein
MHILYNNYGSQKSKNGSFMAKIKMLVGYIPSGIFRELVPCLWFQCPPSFFSSCHPSVIDNGLTAPSLSMPSSLTLIHPAHLGNLPAEDLNLITSKKSLVLCEVTLASLGIRTSMSSGDCYSAHTVMLLTLIRSKARHWWFTSVILASPEAESKRITVQSQLRQIPNAEKGYACLSTGRSWVHTPVPPKKKEVRQGWSFATSRACCLMVQTRRRTDPG